MLGDVFGVPSVGSGCSTGQRRSTGRSVLGQERSPMFMGAHRVGLHRGLTGCKLGMVP